MAEVKIEREGGKYAFGQLLEIALVMIGSHCRVILLCHAIRFHQWVHDADADIALLQPVAYIYLVVIVFGSDGLSPKGVFPLIEQGGYGEVLVIAQGLGDVI